MTDDGNSWNKLNHDLPGNGLNVTSLTITGNYFFAGTNALVIWSSPSSDLVTSVKENINKYPSLYSLE